MAGLAKAGHLGPGGTIGQAAEIIWAINSPELYGLLVLGRGWTLERYGQFIAQVRTSTLLPTLGT